MAERFKAHAWKAVCTVKGTVGSDPTLSAKKKVIFTKIRILKKK